MNACAPRDFNMPSYQAWKILLKDQRPVFPFDEKNLLNPRAWACFSGVRVEETEEEADLVGLCFGFFAGEIVGRFPSLSDGHKLLEKCKGDSGSNLWPKAEVALSISSWTNSCKFWLLVASSVNPSFCSVWGRRVLNCLPRRYIVSWHSASFSAAAASSLSCD